MEGGGPGNGDGLFQIFGRHGIVRLSLLHKIFLDMLRENQDLVSEWALRTGSSLYLRNRICQLDVSRLGIQDQAPECLQLVS